MKYKVAAVSLILIALIMIYGSLPENMSKNRILGEILDLSMSKDATEVPNWPYQLVDLTDATNEIIARDGWNRFIDSLNVSNSKVLFIVDRQKLQNTVIQFDITLVRNYFIYMISSSEKLKVKIRLGDEQYELVESSAYKMTF